MKKIKLAKLLLSVFTAILFAVGTAGATSIAPTVVTGNPDYADLGYAYGYKIDPPADGIYVVPGWGSIAVDFTEDLMCFDWTSTFGIDAVIVKGGPDSNTFVYNPPEPSFGDTGLYAPYNPGQQQAAISHVEFAWNTTMVPEPLTMLFLGFGLVGVTVLRRRI